MMWKHFIKFQVMIIAIALLNACSSPSTPESSESVLPSETVTPVLLPNNVTLVPRVTSGSTAWNFFPVRIFSGHNKRVLDVAFSAQGEYLASSSQDLNIRLWDVESGEEVDAIRMSSVDMADIDIFTGGNLLASGEAIWDVESFQEIHILERGTIFPGSVAFSPDGSLLALGLFEKEITLWDVTSGKPLKAFERQEENRTKSMDFSPDGTLLAVGVIDGTVRLLDVVSGKIVKILKYTGETDIHHVVFSPDGRYLATGGRVPAVVLWDIPSGEVVKIFRLTDNAISMDFSPDGTILATTGGVEYEVRLWDVESGNLLDSLPHNDQLSSLTFSPDGRLLAVGCFDGNIYLWEVSEIP